MIRSVSSSLSRSIGASLRRGFSSSGDKEEKIVAAVLFERLPVVIPKIDPNVYAFHEFSFQWNQQYRRKYPDEVLEKSSTKEKGTYHIDYVPGPRITEADKTKDIKSLQRALDQRLYLLLYGNGYGAPDDKPIWHFPEKLYENEDTLRLCAESALKSVLGSLHDTYFVGNAPMAHMVIEPKEDDPRSQLFKRFFFKSQVLGTDTPNISKCKDYAWVTKEELLEYFPEYTSLLDNMIIHIK